MENCATDTAALRDLLNTEYRVGRRTPDSVRAALEWYPAEADLAGSLDLAFTTGPWMYTAAGGGTQVHGHFLTLWKRDSACRWQIEFDGAISHAAPAIAEPKLAVDQAAYAKPDAPPPGLIAEDAPGHALSDFQNVARQDDVAAGLRTYARTADFRYYTDGQVPMALGAANRYLTARALRGVWQESVRGRSADASLAYGEGMLTEEDRAGSHTYLQVWQYDPRVANWGLRILLINPAPSPLSK
jgi:hypothetical protein